MIDHRKLRQLSLLAKVIDMQVSWVRLQTDNFRLFLCFFVNKRTNDKLLFVWWANGKRIKENRPGWLPFSIFCLKQQHAVHIYKYIDINIFMFICIYVIYVYLYIYIIHVVVCSCIRICLYLYTYTYIYIYIYIRQLPFVCCKRKNGSLFSFVTKR